MNSRQTSYPTNPLAIEFLNGEPPSDISELWLPNLGDRIRRRRGQLAVTQAELADHMGVSLSAAVYWERLSRPPRGVETRDKLLRWLSECSPGHSIDLREIDSDLIRTERLRRLMTTADLAEVIGVSVETIRKWERGEDRPNRSILKSLREWMEDDKKGRQLQVSGGLIRTERLRRGMTMMDLAGVIGASIRSIRDWEQGKTRPQPSNLRLLRAWLCEEA